MTDMRTVELRDMANNTIPASDYFGGCPECGKTDGYVNLRRDHVFICNEHKTAWRIGSNLFSSWHDETEEDWERNRKKLDAYCFVEPIINRKFLYPNPPPTGDNDTGEEIPF